MMYDGFVHIQHNETVVECVARVGILLYASFNVWGQEKQRAYVVEIVYILYFNPFFYVVTILILLRL
jgi:hypothetical protein